MINVSVLGGWLVSDVNFSPGANGESNRDRANFRIGVPKPFGRENPENPNETIFVGCSVFGQSARFAQKYLQSKSKVIVTGSLYQNKYGLNMRVTDLQSDKQENNQSNEAPVNAAVAQAQAEVDEVFPF